MQMMRRRFAFSIPAAFALVLALSACARNEALPDWLGGPSAPSIIPLPQRIQLGSGNLAIADGSALVYGAKDEEARRIALYLTDLVRRTRDLSLVPHPGDVAKPASGAIVFERLADPNATGAEGYKLSISPDGVRISAGRTAGLFYGAVTFWQLLTKTGARTGPASLDAMSIEDAPRFAWRG